MLVNISDAIAMNAKPKYALISIAIPKSYTMNENLKELSSGFKKLHEILILKLLVEILLKIQS